MWNERYSAAEYVFGTEPNDFLKQYCEYLPAGGEVLCLGEGEGRNAVFLAEQGYKVTAMDMSEVGLQKASHLARERGMTITTQVANLEDYDFGVAKWDAIVSIWVHMPAALRQYVHAQITPALKPNAIVLIEAYTKEQLTMEAIGGPPATQKERFGSLDCLQTEFAALNELVGVEKRRLIAEGKRHQGLSAVVQFIAQKPDIKTT